jgi:two-component system NtrC family sensor kinase
MWKSSHKRCGKPIKKREERAEVSLIGKIKPPFWDESKPTDESHIRLFNYAGLWKYAVLGTSAIALLPLILLLLINHYEYKNALKGKMSASIACLVSNTRMALGSKLSERKAILSFIVNDDRLNKFPDSKGLAEILAEIKTTFREFVDLSLVDPKRNREVHAGPHHLRDKDDRDEVWYKEVYEKGIYISDLHLGRNGFPYFVIAVKNDNDNGNSLILRATVRADWLDEATRSLAVEPSYDTFIVNEKGVLQTESRSYGDPLGAVSNNPEIQSLKDGKEHQLILGAAMIEGSPFRLVTVAPLDSLTGGWFSVSKRFVILMIVSMICILMVGVGIVTHLVNRIYDADRRRVAVLHKIQYTNKMATIGRLSAGVAHEINNPLAVINEQAGLLKDLVSMGKDLPRKRTVAIVDSILSSIQRCSAITHSLLGFAKHIDVKFQQIHLERVINEVLLFVGKESEYRSISVSVKVEENLKPIESDVGQLEQVFLNIINNAFEAVDDGGKIDIELFSNEADSISVRIADNGHGISEENLKHIFDPFFSTKGEKGAGLGLSITYGIVQKLEGKLDVESKKGEGSRFTVTFPIKSG